MMYAVSVRSLDKLFKPQSGRDRPAGASTGALEAVEVSREICRARRTFRDCAFRSNVITDSGGR